MLAFKDVSSSRHRVYKYKLSLHGFKWGPGILFTRTDIKCVRLSLHLAIQPCVARFFNKVTCSDQLQMGFVQKAQFYIQAFEGMLSDDFTLHCLGAFIVSFFFTCCFLLLCWTGKGALHITKVGWRNNPSTWTVINKAKQLHLCGLLHSDHVGKKEWVCLPYVFESWKQSVSHLVKPQNVNHSM